MGAVKILYYQEVRKTNFIVEWSSGRDTVPDGTDPGLDLGSTM